MCRDRNSMESYKERPLSIYIHVPFCARKCAYCDFLSHVPEPDEAAAYFESLLEEIRSWSELLGKRRIRSIFFGGGTPSFVQGEYIAACLEEISKRSGRAFTAASGDISSTEHDIESVHSIEKSEHDIKSGHGIENSEHSIESEHDIKSGHGIENSEHSIESEQDIKSGHSIENSEHDIEGKHEADLIPEITLEANPGTFGEEKLRLWRQAGINRLSIGLQSADDEELARLGRIHSWKMFEENYLLARSCGFDNINIDLMSALPGQTTESWRRTLEKVLALRPEHISAYSLIIEEGTPFYELYGDSKTAAGPSALSGSAAGSSLSANTAAGSSASAGIAVRDDGASVVSPAPLPSEEDERQMYHFTKMILKQHGYERYEISNYSLPGYECRHNIVYWTGGDYLGIGLGASSYIEGRRFRAPENMDEYRRYAVSEKVLDRYEKQSKNEEMEEFMFLGLRMMEGVSAEDFNRRFSSYEKGGADQNVKDYQTEPVRGTALSENDGADQNVKDYQTEPVGGTAPGENVGCDLFSKLYGDVVERYISMGLLQKAGGRISFTDEGIDVSNRVLADFML